MNEAEHSNKYMPQMLVYHFHLFQKRFFRLALTTLLLVFLLLTACTPKLIEVERIQLGDWTVHDAKFSRNGVLALSVSQDIGFYSTAGDLLYLLNLPEPHGIWQLTWQDNNNLWLYDKYNLYHWSFGAPTIAPPKYIPTEPIRFVQASKNGLMLVTEQGTLQWFEINQQQQLAEPRLLLDNLPHISSLGFTQQNQPYVASHDGQLWLWDSNAYNKVQQFNIGEPIHEVFQIKQHLYALSSRYNNPLATGNQLTLWQLSPEQAPQAHKLRQPQGVFTTLVMGDYLLIGGSNSTWQSINLTTYKQSSGALPSRNPSHQARLVAIYEEPHVILMLSSRGELQKWRKSRILHPNQ